MAITYSGLARLFGDELLTFSVQEMWTCSKLKDLWPTQHLPAAPSRQTPERCDALGYN